MMRTRQKSSGLCFLDDTGGAASSSDGSRTSRLVFLQLRLESRETEG
jgi:hypothetical protein